MHPRADVRELNASTGALPEPSTPKAIEKHRRDEFAMRAKVFKAWGAGRK